jgi:hypothetical protein
MENLNLLFFEYFIEAPVFEKQLVAWAMIRDKRINENTAKKLLLFVKHYLSGTEKDQFMKEWKEAQEAEYAFTGSWLEWQEWKKSGYPVPVPITKESIRELKGYFARLDGTLLVDCVYRFVRNYDIFSEYPSKNKVERKKKPSILDEIQVLF